MKLLALTTILLLTACGADEAAIDEAISSTTVGPATEVDENEKTSENSETVDSEDAVEELSIYEQMQERGLNVFSRPQGDFKVASFRAQKSDMTGPTALFSIGNMPAKIEISTDGTYDIYSELYVVEIDHPFNFTTKAAVKVMVWEGINNDYIGFSCFIYGDLAHNEDQTALAERYDGASLEDLPEECDMMFYDSEDPWKEFLAVGEELLHAKGE